MDKLADLGLEADAERFVELLKKAQI